MLDTSATSTLCPVSVNLFVCSEKILTSVPLRHKTARLLISIKEGMIKEFKGKVLTSVGQFWFVPEMMLSP